MEKSDVIVYVHKTNENAVVPEVAYNGTSACFDLTCTKTVIIPAKGSAVVENGLNVCIDQHDMYWMQIQLRSSKGFKYDLIPHYGTVDGGYTGPLGIKVYNVGELAIEIEEGEKYAQIAVIPKPIYSIIELNDEEFKEFEKRQIRGSGGFGSSGK